MNIAHISSPLGTITLGAKLGKIVLCKCSNEAPTEHILTGELAFARDELLAYFEGRLKHFSTPLMPEGSDFCVRVWEQLCKVEYGKTATYGQIAAQIGKPKAARAVGTACGKNPLWIFVPCHRILQTGGGLGGYAGGLHTKTMLLGLERGEGAANN